MDSNKQGKQGAHVISFRNGLILGLVTLSIAFAAVPRGGRVTDDTAIYQKLTEIRVPKESSPNFDGDIARLSQAESRYKEKLPSLARNPKLLGPMNRIAQQKYRYSGAKRAAQSKAQKPVKDKKS